MKKQNHISISRAVSVLLNLFLSGAMFLLMHSSLYALTVQVDPQDLSMGIGYHGSRLLISGQHEPGEQVIIRITAQTGEAHLKYKGKAGGVLWMKMGDMIFKPVPMLYIVRSPEPLARLLPESELTKYNLGYNALSAKITIESAKTDLDPSFWVTEFIKFKEDENLYLVDETMVPPPSSDDSDNYQYQLDWPYQAPPGTYRLEVFAVRDQQVLAQTFKELTVKRSGIVAFLSNLAFNRPALYGLIAVFIAALAGLSVGMIFKGGGAH